jgi:argininosuccinate lyase
MTNRMSNYTVSIHYDRRLYKQDIAGSIAHVRMLARQSIIETEEADSIVSGLEQIREEIETGIFPWRNELEDIHMNVERRLHEKIGQVAGKLHTARSRNDQVALDFRLYAKDAIDDILKEIHGLRQALVFQAEANARVVMPGYTHLQRAQPVEFGHHMLAYFEMFGRDAERFHAAKTASDSMPLGSGALAGVPYPIDRASVAEELGFSKISSNSMDAVSDRDFVLAFHSAASICMMHLSRIAEELVMWSTDEFNFIRLADEYTTGSSIMPQKRNPDYAELARGRTGRVYGNLMALLTTMKGLPLTYNRDMQEDKEGLFDSEDVIKSTLTAMKGMISTMEVEGDNMRQAAYSSYLLATDITDYLVGKGMPFREAHGIVSRISEYTHSKGKLMHEISLDTYRQFSDLFDEGVFEITVDSSVLARDVPGGTSFSRVELAIKAAVIELEEENDE